MEPLPPLPGSVKALASKPQITRKQFLLIKAIFDEYDRDQTGQISEDEFVAAVLRLDVKKAEREGERVRARFLNKDIGDTVGAQAESRLLKGERARSNHAVSMYRSVVEKKGKLELVDLCELYFPHLPRSAVKRACDHHAEKPPPPAAPKSFDEKLDEATGAREEITDIFEALDTDGDGLVRMRSLEPLLIDLGITEKDMSSWMQDGMIRTKSKLNVDDMHRLLGSAYIPSSPRPDANGEFKRETLESLKRQISWDQNLALEIIYGKA